MSISYEIAKKLKESGFPQVYGSNQDGYANDGGYEPHLHELIEACGDGIFELLRQSEWHKEETGFVWIATLADVSRMKKLSISEVEKSMIKGGGLTPEEAVANLYLALHKT